jgi:PAS domain S-box-containing protein
MPWPYPRVVTAALADKVAFLAQCFDAFNRRDVEAWVEFFHPEAEVIPAPYWAPPGTTYHGRPGIRSLAHEMFRALPHVRAEPPQEVWELGDLLLVRVVIASSGDQPAAGRTMFNLYRFREGQIGWVEGFTTQADALEAAQWQSESTFRVLFERTSDAVFLTDDQATFIDANPAGCDLYGLSADQLRRRTIFELTPPDLVGELKELWQGFRSHGQLTSEAEILSGAGKRHRVEVRAKANFVPRRHLVILMEAAAEGEADGPVRPRLTPREREVFRLLALGFTGSEVAERLVLSPYTVRRHVEKGITRLRARNRVQAIAIALTSDEIQL